MSELLDRLYRWVWRVPVCTPGSCYCRRGCPMMFEDPSEALQRVILREQGLRGRGR